MSDSRKAKLKRFLARANELHGRGTVTVGAPIAEIPRLSTGSLSLDVALGGGLPVGRVSMLYGKRSSGKSTVAYRIAAIAQGVCANCYRPAKIEEIREIVDEETGEVEYRAIGHCTCYRDGVFRPRPLPSESQSAFQRRLKGYEKNSYEEFVVALIDQEGSFDLSWAHKIGLDDRRMLIVRPDTAEEAVDLYDALVRTGSVDLVILDSIAAMTPSAEVEESAEKWQQGLQARLVNKLVRKAGSAASAVAREHGRLVTQLWINQIRHKIGVMFGSPEVRPGGMGQEFVTSCEVKLWSQSYETDEVDEGLAKDRKLEVGVRAKIGFEVTKNKTAPPKAKGMVPINLRTSRFEEEKLFESLLERYGYLTKDGSRWVLFDKPYKSKSEAMATIFGDPDGFRRAYVTLLKTRLGAIQSPKAKAKAKGKAKGEDGED